MCLYLYKYEVDTNNEVNELKQNKKNHGLQTLYSAHHLPSEKRKITFHNKNGTFFSSFSVSKADRCPLVSGVQHWRLAGCATPGAELWLGNVSQGALDFLQQHVPTVHHLLQTCGCFVVFFFQLPQAGCLGRPRAKTTSARGLIRLRCNASSTFATAGKHLQYSTANSLEGSKCEVPPDTCSAAVDSSLGRESISTSMSFAVLAISAANNCAYSKWKFRHLI